MTKSILVVLTSHDQLLTGKPTGWYLPELAHPYYAFKKAGYTLTAASPKGGKAPLDQTSVEMFKEDAECKQFLNDSEAQEFVNNTKKLSEVDTKGTGYDAIFYPGGHGPCFDLPEDAHSNELIKNFFESKRPVSAVCHAPVAFCNTKLSDGSYILKDRQAVAFTNEEEEQAGMTDAIPYLVETRMIERGAKFEKSSPWQEKVLVDKDSEGRVLITGQNPASAAGVGQAIIKALA
ncbi:class I glutamine amidotransferase-like protein [Tilletiaria anomala UBC 951]|uniref:D-lactate dehydratase n=1 Tax=Tilletiaria anomala (strain ATCC 24038 / CBS 436.72 / UBC 951) TaxID=1037660 RepID=A0A066VQG2_TILAU|nr:class I glutamine amidotransferase-like protein [Tilletiaria anomala UBC 951]KDN42508.1 class I glutamine amidotransferase-like protein [Tilletiaria anomala UBC 951]